ncbi:MAG: 30S ribosomal protein S17 [Alcanivorax sp.]
MPRRILEGNVVSAKTDKTVTVLVERRFMHPMYKKYIKSSSKYTAHDEANTAKEGDRVSIIECRPISKTKRWTIVTGDQPAAEKKAAPKKEEAKKAAPKKEAKKEDKKPAAKKKAAPKKTTKKKDA